MKIKRHPRLKSTERISLQLLAVVWVTVCTIFSLIPLFITILNSFKSNTEIITSIYAFPDIKNAGANLAYNYSVAWTNTVRPLLRSILTAGVGTFLNMAIGVILAYIFCHKQFHFKEGIYITFILIMLIPSVMGMPVLLPFVTNGLGLKDTYLGYWLPIVGGGQVGGLFLFRTFFNQQPKSIFESAKIEGANDVNIILYIVIPLALPIMLYFFVGTFASEYNDYLWPSLIFNDKQTLMPMILSLSEKFNREQGVVYAIYIIACIPLCFNTVISLKHFQGGDFAAGMKL